MKSVRELISEGSLAPKKIKSKYINNAMFVNDETLQSVVKGQKEGFLKYHLSLAATAKAGLFFGHVSDL